MLLIDNLSLFAAFNFPNLACYFILLYKKSNYWLCILHISLDLICQLVIFLLLFHAGFTFLWLSSCFLWKMEPFCSVYTAGWKTRPPDCKYKHGTGFFRPVHSHSYHSRAIKVFEEISILPKPDTFLFSSLCSCLFCIEVVLCSYESLEIVFAWFIFMAQQSGDFPNVKVIYLAVHPLLGFCVVRRPILHFMTYCVKQVPRQTGGSPDVRSSWTRLTKLEVPSSIL